jgi:uncharacterized protein YbcC (UPF0753/DUF2309 family)
MYDIIARHDLVRRLMENDWLHLFRIGEDGDVSHRLSDGRWEPVNRVLAASA